MKMIVKYINMITKTKDNNFNLETLLCNNIIDQKVIYHFFLLKIIFQKEKKYSTKIKLIKMKKMKKMKKILRNK